jgi:uncharacterized membrane protein
METSVPNVTVWMATILGFASMMAFLYLIDYAARLLRPVSILWRVGEDGLAVIQSVYPNPIKDTDVLPSRRHQLGTPDQIVTHQGTSAIMIAANLDALVAEARRADGVIEVVPRVGDFVAVGEPIFRLRGGSFDERGLRDCGLCLKIWSQPCRKADIPLCVRSLNCSIARLRSSTFSHRIWWSRVSLTPRAWAGHQAPTNEPQRHVHTGALSSFGSSSCR